MAERFVIIDVETTGNTPKRGDRIIQIGAAVVENGQIVDQFSSFVNPEMEVPPFIVQLTKISDEHVKGAPLFNEIAPRILELLNDSYFVAHNVPFDLSFLQMELDNSGYDPFHGPTIDTVELARLLLPTEESYKLNQLATSLQIEHSRPHQADSDAEVTAHIFLYLLRKLNDLPLFTLERLKPIAKKLDSNILPMINKAIQSKLRSISSQISEYDEFRQMALKKQPFPIIDETYIPTPSFSDDKNNIQSRLLAQMDQYEPRLGQMEMMDLVDESLSNNQHALIEAGTGIGKSLGYLYPAVYFAKQHDRSVVVSTHTVQLQQQIIDRDIKLISTTVPFSFHWAILKGRSHYLCLRKFENELNHEMSNNYDATLSKGQILIWLLETEDGDVEQLSLPSNGNSFWIEVQSDATSCFNKNCPWFSRCFYHRARNKANGADVIVTNHALLFTDVTSDHSLLPSYKQVIIDEAHHLEDVATDHFGVKTDYYSFVQLFSRIGTIQSTDLLHRINQIQGELGINLDEKLSTLQSQIELTKLEIDECFTSIHSYTVNRTNRGKSNVSRRVLRYIPNELSNQSWSNIIETIVRTETYVKEMIRQMKGINSAFIEIEDQLTFSQAGIVTSYRSLILSVQEELDKLERLFLQYDPNYVYWIEVDAKGAKNATYIYAKPIVVSEILADQFFQKKSSVIMTSATLSVKNSFQYIIQQLGLDDFGVTTKMINSPFSYEEQVQLMVPTSIPNIKEVSDNEYIYDVVISILDIAKITKGRMLVLFTSYDMLKKAYYQLKDFIANEEFMLFGQGITSGSRAKLTKNFKQFDQAILFGTSSFWEGVDIPGEDLSCLIIVRLPFSPPDNPVFEAKSDNLKQLGKNSFMELSLPQAIIRFKQGFGRLIRSSKDRGVVFVFDRRITETRYGKLFTQSLPPLPIKQNSLDKLLMDLKNWL